MSTTLVATPTKNSASEPAGSPSGAPQSYQPSPGRFRHPRLTEIIERRSRTSLGSRNVHNAGINAIVLISTFVLGDLLHTIGSTALTAVSIPPSALDTYTVLFIVRAFLLLNTVLALRPAIPYLSKADDFNDIPLTPSQRALLGLSPCTPSTTASGNGGGENFITPPRYRRNSGISTPTSGASTDRRSISADYSSSPLSTSRHTVGFSPSSQQQPASSSWSYRRASGSPFSPSPNGSPLLYKAVTQNSSFGGGSYATNYNNGSDLDVSRNSLNTSTASGFGASRSQSIRDRRNGNGGGDLDNSMGPGTPSPTGRRLAAGGINYKWLYDRGSRLPKSDTMAL